MRTALEIEVETAEKINELAKERNVTVEELLSVYIPGLALAHLKDQGGADGDKVEQFEQWVRSFPANTAPLTDDGISRASIYQDR
jgi:hypothetical protein